MFDFSTFFSISDNSKPPAGQMQKQLWDHGSQAHLNIENGCQSAILEPILLKFCTLIHSLIVYKFPIHYVNYDYGSHKLWSSDFRPNSAKKDARQSAILDPIRLKLCTLIHSMIVYKFPIHYVYKLWSWVTQIMKVLIFCQIQQQGDHGSLAHLALDVKGILALDVTGLSKMSFCQCVLTWCIIWFH